MVSDMVNNADLESAMPADDPARPQGPGAAPSAASTDYRKMYDRISSLAKIGVWEFDLTTEKMSWTDEIYDMFELPRGSALDRPAIVAMYEDGSRKAMERLRTKAINTGGSFAADICIRTASGGKKWLRLTGDVEQEDGRSVRIFGTKQDISEVKAAQEKLQALQAELIHASRESAMGAMVATLAHDLNQPLTAIGNYAAGTRRVVKKGAVHPEMVEAGLQAIERNAAALGNMIRKLRELNGRQPRRPAGDRSKPVIPESGSLDVASEPEGYPARHLKTS